jgi:hypothetical protein
METSRRVKKILKFDYCKISLVRRHLRYARPRQLKRPKIRRSIFGITIPTKLPPRRSSTFLFQLFEWVLTDKTETGQAPYVVYGKMDFYCFRGWLLVQISLDIQRVWKCRFSAILAKLSGLELHRIFTKNVWYRKFRQTWLLSIHLCVLMRQR